MAIAGTLEIQMVADIARITDDMAKVRNTMSTTGSHISSVVDSAKSALAALGIGLSINYFKNLVEHSIDAMDHLHDLGLKTKLSIETLGGLKLAATQSGSSLDEIASSINKLAVNMGKSPEKFKELGISATDPLEAFKQLADILNQIENPQLRAATAAIALGKSWQGAAPLIAEGSIKIGEMVEKGTKLYGVTKQDADNADEFKDRLDELKIAQEGLTAGFTKFILPGLVQVATKMADAARDGGLLKSIILGIGEAGKVLLFGADPTKIGAQKKYIAGMGKELKDAQAAQDSLKAAVAAGSKQGWMTESINKYTQDIASLKLGIEQATIALQNMQDQAKKPIEAPDAAAGDRAKEFVKGAKGPFQKQSFGGDQFGGGLIKTGMGGDFGSGTGSDVEGMPGGASAYEIALQNQKTYGQVQLATQEAQQKESLASVQKYESWWTAAQRRGLEQRRAFSSMSLGAQAKEMFGLLVEMTQGVSQNNRAMFEINKVASMASVALNSIDSISKAYNFGSTWGGPAGGAAMAAIAVAATAAHIAAIAGTQFGGGSAPSIAGSTPATPVTPVGASNQNRQTTVIHLSGDNFSPRSVKALIEQINEQLLDGQRIVVA